MTVQTTNSPSEPPVSWIEPAGELRAALAVGERPSCSGVAGRSRRSASSSPVVRAA